MRPNILYIMSDDHASNAVSAYGSRLAKDAPTPNIDRIGKQGMRLENCHCCNSICTPSRATILSGQHSHVNGVKTLADELPESCILLSEILQENGYQTAIFGKWHLRCVPRGFDDWAILPGQGLYNDPVFFYPDKTSAPQEYIAEDPSLLPGFKKYNKNILDGGVSTQEPGYVTDIITDKTLNWLANRDREKPFYLCCHHKAPHDMFEFDHKHENIFDGVVFAEPDTLFEDEDSLKEISRKYGSTVSERWAPRNLVKTMMDQDYPNGGAVDFSELDFYGKASKAYQKYMQDYLRTVRSIDDNVGRILDYLEQEGLTDNTIIVYTSDQGMMLGEHDKIDKRWIFDESQRMPFMVRYPREIPAGSVSDELVDNTDFAPTFLDYAGIDIPEFMQGYSFRALLAGKTLENRRQSVYYRYWMHMAHLFVPAHYGIRTKDYKLVFFYGMKLDAKGCPEEGEWSKNTEPGFELYDLKNDPLESKNVYHDPAYCEIREKLKKQLLGLKYELGDSDEAYPELMNLQKEFF